MKKDKGLKVVENSVAIEIKYHHVRFVPFRHLHRGTSPEGNVKMELVGLSCAPWHGPYGACDVTCCLELRLPHGEFLVFPPHQLLYTIPRVSTPGNKPFLCAGEWRMSVRA